MSDLFPPYLSKALTNADIYGDDAHGVVTLCDLIVEAIRRYASEREAAALEKAAKAVSALCFGEIERLNGISADRPHEFKFGPGVPSPRLLAMNDALAAIRSLIPKEANT